MTGKQTYWLVDETGTKALVEGAAERDRWVPRGWAESTEPTGSEFFYAWLDGVTVPARLTAAARDVWEIKGWKPGPPPEPASPFNGDQLGAAPASADAAESGTAETTTTSGTPRRSRTAAGGEE